jgi:hypothetical protein
VLLETEVLIVTSFSFQKGPTKYYETKTQQSLSLFFQPKKKSNKEFENSTFPSLNEHYENRV